MSEKANYFKLGLFVVVGVAVTLVGVGILGAGAVFRRTIVTETYMEESVQGLDVGAPVKHRGVQVGKVSRIAFLGEEYGLTIPEDGTMNLLASYVYVEMELDVERRGENRSVETYKSAVKSGLRARLASTGLVGNVYVDLYFPARGAEIPAGPAISWEPRSLYIPSSKSMIAELTATISGIARQLEDAHLDHLVTDVDTLVRKVGDKVDAVDVAGMQREITALVTEIRSSNARVQQLLANPEIDSILKNIAATSESVRRLAGESEQDLAAFLKDLPVVSARIKSSAGEIDNLLKDQQTREILADVATAANLAPDAAAEVRRLAQRLNTLLASQQSDMETIIVQLRRTTENLQRLSEDAAANPSRILFGDPPSPVRRGVERQK